MFRAKNYLTRTNLALATLLSVTDVLEGIGENVHAHHDCFLIRSDLK